MNNPGLENDHCWGEVSGGQHAFPLRQGKMLDLKLLKQQICGTKGTGSAHMVKLELVANTKLVFMGGNLQQCHGARPCFRKADRRCSPGSTFTGQAPQRDARTRSTPCPCLGSGFKIPRNRSIGGN